MLHLRDMDQYIIGHFKSQQKDIFVNATYIKIKSSNVKMIIIKVVGDILSFQKSPRSPSYDKNLESYGGASRAIL